MDKTDNGSDSIHDNNIWDSSNLPVLSIEEALELLKKREKIMEEMGDDIFYN